MKFGAVPLAEAGGAILAHSVKVAGGLVKKGTVLSAEEIEKLSAAGIAEVVVAVLEPGDLTEDAAALRIAECLKCPGLRLGPASTGRVNVIAEAPGLIKIDAERIAAMNSVDEGLTLATLPDMMRVAADQLVATIKIIPYAVPGRSVERAAKALGDRAIRHLEFRGGLARLILTVTDDIKQSLILKGEASVRSRVEALGFRLPDAVVVSHDTNELADALDGSADLTLILGASATSDRLDVAPAAVVRAGGTIERFGMPVDPGNLLFIGVLNGRPVVGLPGCARSPALNGADWVLERLAAGLAVTGPDVAAMGVGGLLKEMPDRPHPRRPREKG